jgi:hypothetical protein
MTLVETDTTLLEQLEPGNPPCEYVEDWEAAVISVGAGGDADVCGVESDWGLVWSCGCVAYFCDSHHIDIAQVAMTRVATCWLHGPGGVVITIARWEKL